MRSFIFSEQATFKKRCQSEPFSGRRRDPRGTVQPFNIATSRCQKRNDTRRLRTLQLLSNYLRDSISEKTTNVVVCNALLGMCQYFFIFKAILA